MLGPGPALAPRIQEPFDLLFGQLRTIAAEALTKHRFTELGKLERQSKSLRGCRVVHHGLKIASR